ncbi:proline--tRNA ligase [Buchnera aphidicola]|uniref:proline--tRNA ligase n=1 Tax=Buchnera aphidicola TaxID=9 RepID=UPI0030EF0F93
MKTDNYLISTMKENPKNIKNKSHSLMLRSGMIRKTSSGIYIWLPNGLKVLKKIKNIIKILINNIKGIEIDLPLLQSKKLWIQSNRINTYGKELFKLIDKNNKKFVLGSTHEEIITKFISKEILSYKKLPLILYQIKKKFRDEIRPRNGVVRSKEFIMKDAYSFHENKTCLKKTYLKFYKIYKKIFNFIKLKFCIVKTKSKTMGGKISHEFHAFSKDGEDKVIFYKKKNKTYIFKDFYKKHKNFKFFNLKKILKIQKTIFQNSKNKNKQYKILNTYKIFFLKTVKNCKYPTIAILTKKKKNINIKKIKKIKNIFLPIKFLNKKKIFKIIKINLKKKYAEFKKIPIFIDYTFLNLNINQIQLKIEKKIISKINWKNNNNVNIKFLKILKKSKKNKKNKKIIFIKNSIEIAHIFQLNKKYSKIFKAKVQNKNSHNKYIEMGCYGIGISRLISVIINQNYDKNGIIWPIDEISPFYISIIPINIKKKIISLYSQELYKILIKKKFDVIFFNTPENPGTLFSNSDLMGIPYKIIINEKNLRKELIEIKIRKNNKCYLIKLNKIIKFFKKKQKLSKKKIKKLLN